MYVGHSICDLDEFSQTVGHVTSLSPEGQFHSPTIVGDRDIFYPCRGTPNSDLSFKVLLEKFNLITQGNKIMCWYNSSVQSMKYDFIALKYTNFKRDESMQIKMTIEGNEA